MSVTQSTTEKFEEIMNNVPSEAVYAPSAIMECRQTQIKQPPLSEARKQIDEKSAAKKKAVGESKKKMTEAAENISDLYSNLVLEGVLDQAKVLNPESSEKIESLKMALSEAALAAKEFLA
ncbi:MAG: hypothetical protein WC358_03540 [Ignavibacteria bacterium]|jgi:hypothetical protein